MNKENIWTNSDGLYVGFGTRDAEAVSSTKVSYDGVEQEVALWFNGEDLSATVTASQLANAPVIPAGALIRSCQIIVVDAFTDVNGELNVGGWKADDSAVQDADGFDAAVDVAALVAEAVITCDGDYIGQKLSEATKVVVDYDTAAFTDGKACVVVKYLLPPIA